MFRGKVPLPALLALFIFETGRSFAAVTTPLPYSTRTNLYSGFFTTVHGDIRTVGMAGATVGLADSYIAALDNPSGLAMTVGVGDDNFTSDLLYDNAVQNSNNSITLDSFGFAVGVYPWAFSLGYNSPYREDASYTLTDGSGGPNQLDVTVRELHFGAARMFLHDKLAVGVNLIIGQAERAIDFMSLSTGNLADHHYAVSGTLGAMYQLPKHSLIGFSFTPPVTYGASNTPTPALPGFYQPVSVPWRLGVGLGWISNRFFRTDLTLFLVGATPGAALLKDNSDLVGRSITLQPRYGAAYTFIDYKEFSATAFLGTYYEVTRIEDARSRIHLTGGIETKPWIFTVGWGADTSAGYKNYLASISVDIFKTMSKLDLIPSVDAGPHLGVLPNPQYVGDIGLPRPLVHNWVAKGPAIDPLDVATKMPGKIQQKFIDFRDSIQNIFTPSNGGPVASPDRQTDQNPARPTNPGAYTRKSVPPEKPATNPLLTDPGEPLNERDDE